MEEMKRRCGWQFLSLTTGAVDYIFNFDEFFDSFSDTGITEVQPIIPLLLNSTINLARPIPAVQEYPPNPPPIPPPPEKYYASTEICKVSCKNVR